MGIYMSGPLSRGPPPYSPFFSFLVRSILLFDLKRHHSFAPTLASAGARARKICQGRGAVAARPKGLSLIDRAPR